MYKHLTGQIKPFWGMDLAPEPHFGHPWIELYFAKYYEKLRDYS